MAGLETNIFNLRNLATLTSDYRVHRIYGLRVESDEYYRNCSNLERHLSYKLRKPVLVQQRGEETYLIVRADAGDLPRQLPAIRTTVQLDASSELLHLNFTLRSPENDRICLRFLQFMVQDPLYSNTALWQPQAGKPFFLKTAERVTDAVARHLGFSVRAMITPVGDLGLCVDVVSKYVNSRPLPTYMTRDAFFRWKGRWCVYRFGHTWYEIQLRALDDRHVGEYLISDNGHDLSLIEYLTVKSPKPLPPELAQLPSDAAVVIYRSNNSEDRAAPGALCYPVINEEDQQRLDRTMEPHRRRQAIHDFVTRFLTKLRYQDKKVEISPEPMKVHPQTFTAPDFLFGGGRSLSVRGTPNARHTSLDRLGAVRQAMLLDDDAGFYVTDPLDRQYLILPESIVNSCGTQFSGDLKATVQSLYPHQPVYDPIIVSYNDRVPKTYVAQGRAIRDAVDQHCTRPGYAVVMVHHISDRVVRQEDQLEAMVIRELRERQVAAAVIHPTTSLECYEMIRSDAGPQYRSRREKRGKLTGYLRNVALNKVLLTNQRWPFILGTPLHADITIGIDVKYNTAGLVVVGKNGASIRSLCKTSRQKEQLLADQVASYLVEIISDESQASGGTIRTIVLQRDGRVWPSEIAGARRAIDRLKRENFIASDATLTIVEVQKKGMARLRLFDLTERQGRTWIENPQIGTYCIIDEREGFLCSTGRAFPRRGTVQPLHILKVEGPLSIKDCLEDIYALSSLAWTRPEDCSRYPITVKLNDRFLGEDAADYDANALEYAPTAQEASA